ncbi:MAG: Holliday junction resolvase RuvX [Ignavibacteria bacterium]|nr:Holliday junction resolvase RuvX [Ignavibacteria bacterium]
MNLKELLSGKRIAGIDFGLKRIGVAVCDELHISINPKKVFYYDDPDFWDEFVSFLKKERISALVVGLPVRDDDKVTDVLVAINSFIAELSCRVNLPIFQMDESFSTKRATKLMIDLGKSKLERMKKESKDLISACIILNDFIKDNGL